MPRLFIATVQLDPDERLDYTENWADVLTPIDDLIAELTCTVTDVRTGAPVTGLDIYNSQFTDLDTTMWLENCTAGVRFAASFLITTVARRKFKRSIRVIGVRR
jgi:hypothetical protein